MTRRRGAQTDQLIDTMPCSRKNKFSQPLSLTSTGPP